MTMDYNNNSPMTATSALSDMSLEKLKQSTSDRTAQVDKVAEEFESIFIGVMIQQMTAGVKTDEEFGGGAGEDMWRGMMNNEYGKIISKSGGLGIADSVRRELLKLQEVPNNG